MSCVANGADRARTRVLDNEELRDLWAALDMVKASSPTFAALVRMLLLSGQRREEVAGMTWEEIGRDDVWEIAAERYKTGKPHAVPLSAAARAIIGESGTGLVFTTDGRHARVNAGLKRAVEAGRTLGRPRVSTAVEKRVQA
jgi:integrase